MMKKIAFVMGFVSAILLAVACSKGSSKSDRDDDADDDTEETVDFSLADMKDALKDAMSGCEDWTAEDCLEFHKVKTQLCIDFFESDPTAEDWLEYRRMMDNYRMKMVRKMGVTDMGNWPYEQNEQYRLDDEAEKLDAKLKKVNTKWKKAHADELSEVIARPTEENGDGEEPTQEAEDGEEEPTLGNDGEEGAASDRPAPTGSGDENVYPTAEVQPSFPGDDLYGWIDQNLKYPTEALSNRKEGKVICQFIVEKDGSVSNATVLRSDDPVFNDAAIDLINSMPRWTPGKTNGQVVRVSYTLPLVFKLTD